jgi:hypothetical protein
MKVRSVAGGFGVHAGVVVVHLVQGDIATGDKIGDGVVRNTSVDDRRPTAYASSTNLETLSWMEEVDDCLSALVLERFEHFSKADYLELAGVCDEVDEISVVVGKGDGSTVRAKTVSRRVFGEVEGGHGGERAPHLLQ